MKKVIEYIVYFLIGEQNKSLAEYIYYGIDKEKKHSVLIEKSDFFNKDIYMTLKSVPQLPLKEINGIPILFGEPRITKENGQIIIHADLIASTFFLISRYEECVRRDVRDEHGRFIGKESLAYKAGFLNRPIVEEYGALLRQCLRDAGLDVKEPQPGFSHIYLTHDVDQIWTWNNYYRALRTVIKRIIKNERNKLQPVKAVYDFKKYDPAYTFPEIVKIEDNFKKTCEVCSSVYFIMGCTKKTAYDLNYILNKERTEQLLSFLKLSGAEIGVHTSYQAAQQMNEFSDEIKRIENIGKVKITKSRNHFLASREPEDFRYYIDAGIKDDYTMGYADVAGFRIGTCRPVRWIDPITRELTSLTLHPMTTMECTLDTPKYMGISDENKAFTTVTDLVDRIYRYYGEITLLWHNDSLNRNRKDYRYSLYIKTLRYISNLLLCKTEK